MTGKSNSNELLIKVIEEAAGQKQDIKNILTRLTDISSDLKRFVSMTEKLHHTVYGNGEKGIVDRIEALEEWQVRVNETMHEAKGGGRVVAFLFGIAAAIIGFIAERFFK